MTNAERSEGDATPAAAGPVRKRRRGWRVAWRCAELMVLLALLPVFALVIAILLTTDNRLRLPQGAETRIATALDTALSTHDVSVREVEVALPEGQFNPEIVLAGVELRDNEGLRAFFPEISVVVNGPALLQGEFRPRRVRLDQAGLRLARDADGVIDLTVSTGQTADTLGITETLAQIDALFSEPAFSELEEISGTDLVLLLSDEITGQLIQSQDAEMALEKKGDALTLRLAGSVAASITARVELAVTRNPALGRNDILFSFEEIATSDLATASPALRWLDLLRAPMTGRLVGAVADDGRVGDVEGSLLIGPGEFQPRDTHAPVPVEEVRADLRFDATGGDLEFDTLRIISEPLSIDASGRAQVQENGQVLVGQLQFTELTAAPEGLFEQPLSFEGGALDLRLSFQPAFELQIGQAALYDGPLRILAFGSIVAGETGLETRLDARVPELAAHDLFPYWPSFIVPGTRDWVTENLLAGTLRNFAASYRSGVDAPQIGIRFDFDALELRALQAMPPIVNSSGYVSVTNEEFVLSLTEAEVEAPRGGTLDLAGSSMVIADARPRNPDARFDLSVAGPLEAVGSLLAAPPVNLLAESALDPAELATGFAEARVGLDLTFRRVIPREEISFSAQGVLRDVEAVSLVPGRVLTSQALDLTVTPEVVAVAGRAALDGVPLTGRWSQVLGTGAGSRAEGRMTVSPENLQRLGIGLPPGLLSGSGGADFALDLPRGGPPQLQLSSDLAGIGLGIPGLPWGLSRDGTGDFAANLVLGEQPSIPGLTLAAAGLELVSSVDLGAGGSFQGLNIDEGRIGGWADITGRLTPGRLQITGGTLDLRQLGGSGGGGGVAIDASLDRLIVTDGIALTTLRADLGAGQSGRFDARVNGGGALSGTLTRNESGLAIGLQAADAGQILRSAGLFQNAYGGTMALTLAPTGAQGSYSGQLAIDGARLRNAPAMAELLNAISVVGLLEQLGGEGINLGDLDASFRIRPGAIVLDEGTAVGPSMGISMDGVYQTASRSFDMQGVVSPFYLVNGIAGALFAPRREGLFGVTYRLTGQEGATNVTVNPLSILTPGIFREIFRRPPPQIAGE